MCRPVLAIIRLSRELKGHICREPPPPPTNSVIVWFVFMYFALLSVSGLFHSFLSDSCFDSVCQAMRM